MSNPVVGVWIVEAPEAPFPHHVFSFHGDGTMVQSNPDGANPRTADSAGMGLWRAKGSLVVGRFVEVGAWRESRTFAGTSAIAFEIVVNGDGFRGHAETRLTDAAEQAVGESRSTALIGRRFTLDD